MMTIEQKLNHLARRMDDIQAMLEAVADGNGHDVERQLRRKASLREGRKVMGWNTEAEPTLTVAATKAA